jgi:hypothetical protein
VLRDINVHSPERFKIYGYVFLVHGKYPFFLYKISKRYSIKVGGIKDISIEDSNKMCFVDSCYSLPIDLGVLIFDGISLGSGYEACSDINIILSDGKGRILMSILGNGDMKMTSGGVNILFRKKTREGYFKYIHIDSPKGRVEIVIESAELL